MIKRGIYLVANQKSELECMSLIHSIRSSGCKLPIRLIPFGGNPVRDRYIFQEAEIFNIELFPKEGLDLIDELSQTLTKCPKGFLRRFLTWFGDWDEFIYSDNDIIAIMNWEKLFDYLPGHDLVHSDQEYLTMGKFNYNNPEFIKDYFHKDALDSTFTAGHLVIRRSSTQIYNIRQSVLWMQKHNTVPIFHDQSALHIASLLGNWKICNLCREPYSWLSSWSGDYSNLLELIQKIQEGNSISHIHFSGGSINLANSNDQLILSGINKNRRLEILTRAILMEISGVNLISTKIKRLKNKLLMHH